MENVKRLGIVISSKKSVQDNQAFLLHVQQTCGYDGKIYYTYNPNGEMSLTEIYNRSLNNGECDYYVFMHDDIEFMRFGWGAEIVRMFNEHEDYGIIGVAGSGEFDTKAAWWQYKDIYGQVMHKNEGKVWLSAYSELLPTDLVEVCVVDGLFFAVAADRISADFDETYKGFNFYEISFCVDNFINGDTKIGVTTNIRIAHRSIGETKQNWFDNKEKFINDFKDYLPIKVKRDGKKR